MMRRPMRDEAVTEILGFILSFALSAVFLMIAMSSFWTARNNSDAVISAQELRAVADRVAAGVVEAAVVGQEFPNATMNVTVWIPQTLNGHDYYVLARAEGVYVNATDGTASAVSSTFKLEEVASYVVTGRVYSSNEHVKITYSLQGGGLVRSIHIRGD